MKSRLLGMMGLCLSLWSIAVSAAFPPVTRLSIRVVDDLGAPVQGAIVEVGGTDGRVGIKGPTDTNGLYRHDERIMGELGCEVARSGYYQSRGILWSGPSSAGMVPPVNVYTVVLRRIVQPVGMTVRHLSAKMPKGSEQAGFDLEAGAWVAPFGRGTRSDIVVSMQYTDTSNLYEKIQSFSFPNPGDGVIALPPRAGGHLGLCSALPVPNVAPPTGYTNVLVHVQRRRKGEDPVDSTTPELEYLFRVRTVTNATGEVEQANVGWISNGFNLSGFAKDMRFTYYFNPDPHSRSLEPEEIAKRQTGP